MDCNKPAYDGLVQNRVTELSKPDIDKSFKLNLGGDNGWTIHSWMAAFDRENHAYILKDNVVYKFLLDPNSSEKIEPELTSEGLPENLETILFINDSLVLQYV